MSLRIWPPWRTESNEPHRSCGATYCCVVTLLADCVGSSCSTPAPPFAYGGIGWGTLALINAGLAQGKRKSGLLWFLISLFLGPLATLIIVLSPVPRWPGGSGRLA